jgi:phosphate transport system substrate-binding protein
LNENLGGRDGNPAGNNAYPIVSYTWLLFNKQSMQASPDNARAFRSFVNYALTPVAQKTGIPLGYAPLTPEVNQKVADALKSIN